MIEPLPTGGIDAPGRTAHELRLANRARVRRILQDALIHDLKAPLNTATLLLDLLRRSLQRDDPDPDSRFSLAENVDEIRRELRRLTADLDGLRSLADPGEEMVQPFDLVSTLEDSLDLMTQQVLLRGSRLHRRFPEEPLVVSGRPSDVQHAILNVVLNALEATPRSGDLWVDIRAAGPDRVAVTVEDTGPGIPPEIADRLFEPRVSGWPGHDGLGLAVTRGILDEHGGSIRFEPREPRGTRVEIELPRVSATSLPPPPRGAFVTPAQPAMPAPPKGAP